MKNSQENDRPSNFRSIVKKTVTGGSLVALMIAVTPYLFYLHESVPKDKIWNTFLFTYNSRYFGDANTAMWILTGKIIPLYLLLIWFFTCRQWWYHSLIIPIAMYSYQILGFLNDDLTYIDSSRQLFVIVPIIAVIIPSIYIVRARIFYKINEADKSIQELEDELRVSPKSFWGTIKKYF
ncbi:hypothetical protein JJL45_10730 [Tamlana sp. s12]|uniref:hypothetical protein n=1 Tax=Tamlana sp. s12 TaxID=1630406 RepID=UPI0007FC5BAE|nr:hypothetical protein [Tamlana sp. s12]OBQ52464.1 membrane protein [Tamlana sp. s12]QQY81403.1 hypothetical protein JJL45_10730 [Tamlana sp. s12]